MQNNSNDKDWRQRLDGFEDPGNNFNGNASWEKLQQKDPVKKVGTKKILYWVAAASILCITLLTINIISPEDNITTGIVIVKTNPVKKSIEDKPALIIENKETVITATQKNKVSITAEKPVGVYNKPVKEEIVYIKPAPQDFANKLNIDTLSKPVATVSIPPKKLKLVHINEIDPVPGKNGIAHEEGKPYFPTTYPSRQVYSNAAGDNKTGRDNLIRIRLN